MTLLISRVAFHPEGLFFQQPICDKTFFFRSTLEKLKNPQKFSLTEQELDKFLNSLLDDSLLNQITLNEFRSAKKLLIQYARRGTEGLQKKALLEKDIAALFHEEKDLEHSSASLLNHSHFNLKKKGKAKKTFEKLGRFFKKHRKAIIIGVAVVAIAAVATIAVVAAINTAGGAAIAQGVAASAGSATAGAIAANKKEGPQKVEISNTKLASQTIIDNQSASQNSDLKLDSIDDYLHEYNIQQFFPEAYQAISQEPLITTNHICTSTPVPKTDPYTLSVNNRAFPRVNYDELLAQMPLELYGDGISHREKPVFFEPAQVVSCGTKKCPHGKTMFMNGMATNLEQATKYAKALSTMQGGNKVDLIHDPTLGYQKDLLKVAQIQAGCEFPSGTLFKNEILNFFENAQPNQVLHLNVHSRAGAILKQLLPGIPEKLRGRMYIDTYGTAGFIEEKMAKRVRNFWHEDDIISKTADKKGWRKAKKEGTLFVVPSEGISAKDAHYLFGGYLGPVRQSNEDFAKGDLR